MTDKLYQTQPFLKSIRSQVVRCDANGKEYDVVLSQTILYPEGGGQPSDAGRINNVPVKELQTLSTGEIVHRVEKPLEGEVEVTLDWERRLDMMQQHTAQHLLTALAADRFGFHTKAFHLSEKRSDIELDCQSISPDSLAELEKAANQAVFDGLPVTVRNTDPDQLETLGVRTRGLPDGFSGKVRLVEIKGVDLNTCGGTHLQNTSQILAVKLLHTEHLRGGTRLFFVAGGRVLDLMEKQLNRERALTSLLSCGPEDFARITEKMLEEIKGKAGLMKELAKHISQDLASNKSLALFHRDDGDMGFLRAVANGAKAINPELLLLLTAGTREGVFLLTGPEHRVEETKSLVAKTLEGKGGGKGGVFQGKAARLDLRHDLAALLKGDE